MKVGLTDIESRFAAEFLIDLNGTRAYLRVRPECTPAAAAVAASRLLRKDKVQQEIARLKQECDRQCKMDAEGVLAIAWEILRADPREIVECHVGACRACWPIPHQSQAAAEPHDATLAPNRDCTVCGGAGEPRLVLHDTRRLSKGAALLLAGYKTTRTGVEVKLHSKDVALDKLFRYYGLYRDPSEVSVKLVTFRDLTGRKGEPPDGLPH